jgi:hypothetical protein
VAAREIRKLASAVLPPKVARRARLKDRIPTNVYRPHVPAAHRILLWTTPHSVRAFEAMAQEGATAAMQSRVLEGVLDAHVPETLESYASGLTRFTQFCDRLGTSEEARMPASRHLLALFVAEARGTCTGKCIRNWLNGLHLWHTYNDAPWYGDDGLLPLLKKSADKAGIAFKRPPRGPITRTHLRAYRRSLDLDSPHGAAAWSNALTPYHGCRRLGEVTIRSVAKFSSLRDTCRNTRISETVTAGRRVLSIHLVWTKTTLSLGGECILTEVFGADTDLCPIWAWNNHCRINHSHPPDTPLFAYRVPSGWHMITKDALIKSSTQVFKAAGLEAVFGHSYRIGGSLDLLLAGVAPEIIMKLGGWTSLCFLIYWHRLERVTPLALARAWNKPIAEFAQSHGLASDVSSLDFD